MPERFCREGEIASTLEPDRIAAFHRVDAVLSPDLGATPLDRCHFPLASYIVAGGSRAMTGRRDVEEAIKVGERNRDTARLLANWCAHARVEKFGGMGLIEAHTGLPIGHHGIACDYAPAGGVACWDLRDSVIDFYDRNCSICQQRKPIGLPNIIDIITERDRAREQRRACEAAANAQAAEETQLRDKERAALMPALDSMNRAILEDVAAYDRDRSRENLERLIGTARMAPERFQDRLKDFLTSLAERESWFTEVGVLMLHSVGADRPTVARLAMRSFARSGPESRLVEVILDLVGESNADSVRLAFPAIVDLACPDSANTFGPPARRDDRLLLALWKRGRAIIQIEAEQMLASRRRHGVERAGRLLSVLQRTDPAAADPVARSLVSTYVRARLLVDDLEGEDDDLPRLADALEGVFLSAPQLLDGLLQEYAAGSDRISAGRVQKIYARMLRWRRDDARLQVNPVPQRVALTRLVWAATTADDPNTLRIIASAFRHMPDALAPVVRSEIGAMVGAAFLLADRVATVDTEPRMHNEGTLAAMHRQSRRSTLTTLMSHLLEWAAEASVGHLAAMNEFLALMDTMPEGRDELRGHSLRALRHFAGNVEGLQRFLPHLYHGLVGPSVLVRSFAASAVGELRHRARGNVPPLVFETFFALLWDPYVAVHKAAVRALTRSFIPEEYTERVAAALLAIVRHYRTQSGEDDFLAGCVRLLAGMADEFGPANREIRRYLIDVAMGLDPIFLEPEMRFLSHTLGAEPAIGKLAARMLPSMVDRFNDSDSAEALIRGLSPEAVRLHAAELREAATSISHDDLRVSLRLVEKMSRSGASAEAAELAMALVEAFEDNTRSRHARLTIRLVLLALELERAVAAGDVEARRRIRAEWEEASGELAAANQEHRERARRAGFPFPG